MKLNKFLVLLAFFVNLPILSMQTSNRFAPYPSPKRIKVIKTLAKLNEAFSKKTALRTLGRKPSDEEKAAAVALALELENDPLTI